MDEIYREILETLESADHPMSAGELANALDRDPVRVENACAYLHSISKLQFTLDGHPITYVPNE